MLIARKFFKTNILSSFRRRKSFLIMVKLVNENVIFANDDFKDWNWLFFNNKESDCILYSEDGHEFRIHKEILSQTRKMQSILSSSKEGCCGTMQIFCPCSKYELDYIVKFLYTGTISYDKEMDLFKILDNLTEIFGFPDNLFSEEDCNRSLILDETSDTESIKELEIADECHKKASNQTNEHGCEYSTPENSYEKKIHKTLKKQISDTLSKTNIEEPALKKDPIILPLKTQKIYLIRKTNYVAVVHEGKKDITLNKFFSDNVSNVNIEELVVNKDPMIIPLKTKKFSQKNKKSCATALQAGKKSYECNICKKQFTNKTILQKHMVVIHDGNKPFKCDRCEASFKSKPKLKAHIVAVHDRKKPYRNKCAPCDEAFYRKKDLTKHYDTIHNGMKPFKCIPCNHSFISKQGLEKHIVSVHDGKQPFKCDSCEASFSKKGKLKSHFEAVHERKKPNKCEFCDAAFYRKIYLKQHIAAIHKERTPFKCKFCGDCFTSKPELEGHLVLVHDGNKPYKCHLCDSSFFNKTDLRTHIDAVHEGKKPNSITSRNELVVQIDLVHDGKKPFKCDRCEASFLSKSNLRAHLENIHEGKKPNKCEFCDAAYYRKLYLERHVAINHKIEIVPTKLKMVGEMDNQSEKINVISTPMDTFDASNKAAVNAIASTDIITKEYINYSVPLNSENNSTKKDTTHCSRALPSTSKPNVKSQKEILESKSFQDYVAGLIN